VGDYPELAEPPDSPRRGSRVSRCGSRNVFPWQKAPWGMVAGMELGVRLRECAPEKLEVIRIRPTHRGHDETVERLVGNIEGLRSAIVV
jgi:hypothetical protein